MLPTIARRAAFNPTLARRAAAAASAESAGNNVLQKGAKRDPELYVSLPQNISIGLPIGVTTAIFESIELQSSILP